MKIFYAVQATGNGHISRAHELYPYLQELGDVDILISGSNATLEVDFPIKFRSKGISLFYNECGGLHFGKSLTNAKFLTVLKDANSLPLEQYDLIINDFDFVTAHACRKRGLRSVQFGHQASFQSMKTPRPENRSFVGENILKYYAKATNYVGLHFRPYDDFIFPPVIKREFVEAKPEDHGHITVYLPAYSPHCIRSILKEISPREIHWFLPTIKEVSREDNITYFPVSQTYFNESLIDCHGILTGGGFETPSEALHLKKKLLMIPIDGQYEQLCNATALNLLGIKYMRFLTNQTKDTFFNWIQEEKVEVDMPANDIRNTLDFMLEKHNTIVQTV